MKEGEKMNYREYQNLKKSLKDPQFHELLNEYMYEVSEPSNKKEQDDYLL